MLIEAYCVARTLPSDPLTHSLFSRMPLSSLATCKASSFFLDILTLRRPVLSATIKKSRPFSITVTRMFAYMSVFVSSIILSCSSELNFFEPIIDWCCILNRDKQGIPQSKQCWIDAEIVANSQYILLWYVCWISKILIRLVWVVHADHAEILIGLVWVICMLTMQKSLFAEHAESSFGWYDSPANVDCYESTENETNCNVMSMYPGIPQSRYSWMYAEIMPILLPQSIYSLVFRMLNMQKSFCRIYRNPYLAGMTHR